MSEENNAGDLTHVRQQEGHLAYNKSCFNGSQSSFMGDLT